MVKVASVSTARLSRSRLRRAAVAAPLALLTAMFGQLTAAPVMVSATTVPTYYLALGDSLAQGVQPTSTGASVETNHGYVDDLYAVERLHVPGLLLEKLGCPGETTTSMYRGGVCPYPRRTQLAEALAFLGTHHVSLITIDIGANNVDHCVVPTGIDTTCIAAGLKAAGKDLPVILHALRGAAPSVPIYAMNYYDPFLAAWLTGTGGQVLARESVCLTTGYGYPTYCPVAGGYDGLLGSIYAAFGVRVADVATAFETDNFTPLLLAGVPVNVALICTWTWMCAPSPVGPNIHANDTGYAVIATAFVETIGL